MTSELPSYKQVDERSYILEGQKLNQQAPLSSNAGSPEDEPTKDTKQLIEPGDEEKHKTNLSCTSFNYINSIIGSGVIGIPYAFHQAGFGLGLVLLVFVALITDYSLILMVRSSHLCGSFSYQGLMEAAFGKPGYILLSLLQFIYPFIAMVSYNIVVGDTITKVLTRMTGVGPDSLLARREFVVALATVFVTIPLSLFRDIARLAKVSFLSLVFVGFVLLAILIRVASLHDIVPSTPDAWQFANRDVIPAIGIMAFAFMCHHNTFLLYDSIKNADQRQWNIVTHASVLTSLVVAAIFGVAGYATFTGYSQGDLLENYCPSDDLMNIARALFSITILLTYPIECFVTREVIQNILFSSNSNEDHSRIRHVTITLALVISTCFISMSTDCLGVVLGLNGVLAAVPLAYVLPALSYVKLEEGSILSWKKTPALLLGLAALIARCKWSNIKMQFRRAIVKVMISDPERKLDDTCSRYRWFKQLFFLKDHVEWEKYVKQRAATVIFTDNNNVPPNEEIEMEKDAGPSNSEKSENPQSKPSTIDERSSVQLTDLPQTVPPEENSLAQLLVEESQAGPRGSSMVSSNDDGHVGHMSDFMMNLGTESGDEEENLLSFPLLNGDPLISGQTEDLRYDNWFTPNIPFFYDYPETNEELINLSDKFICE